MSLSKIGIFILDAVGNIKSSLIPKYQFVLKSFIDTPATPLKFSTLLFIDLTSLFK